MNSLRLRPRLAALREHWSPRRARAIAVASLPLLVAALVLICGYLFRAPGTAHAKDYQAYGYGALNYSDIIWLYLRDQASAHLRPYLDYRLEYPALTGGLIYLLGFARDLRLYFALTYGVLALCALTAVAALGRLSGGRPWYLAAAPGLFLYTGLNWDLVAIASLLIALVAFQCGRDNWGTLALVVAVWLKLFPIVFLFAVVIERLHARRFRAAATISGLFSLGSVAINLPLAIANFIGWGYFFGYNSVRRAEPSLWTVIPSLSQGQINIASLALLIVGAIGITLFALRSSRPLALPLGGALLLWWLFANKIYSPQYGLWVYMALALLAAPPVLWRAFALLDIAYYYASFQILYTASFPSSHDTSQLISWQARYLLQPLVVVRLLALLAIVGWTVLQFFPWRKTRVVFSRWRFRFRPKLLLTHRDMSHGACRESPPRISQDTQGTNRRA